MSGDEPTIQERAAQPYVAVAATPTMATLGDAIPAGLDRVFGWLADHGIEPMGPPFVRYDVIDMDGELRIQLGVPVETALATDGLIAAELPAGRYASLTFTGPEDGVRANAALLDWAAEQGLAIERWEEGAGEGFGARVEWLLDGPEDDPDPATWRTEVAIMLA